MLLHKKKYTKHFPFALMCEKKKLQIFDFQTLQVPSWNVSSFFILGLESYISLKYKNFFSEYLFLYFLCCESYFLKYIRNIRLENSISRNIRKFRHASALNMTFLKYKKSSVMPRFWIPFVKYKKSCVSWKLENIVIIKIMF